MISYGLGDAGTGLAATQLGSFLFLFFTSEAGLPAFTAGLLLMVVKLWDAFNDPLIGWLSDHTKSRWGPRLPWMVGAAVPLGFSLAAMWWVPPGTPLEKTLYYVYISILLMTAYTSVNLPFAALSTELTEETSIRTRLNAARFTGSILASLAGVTVAALLIENPRYGYLAMGKVTGVIATIATLVSAWGLAPFAKKARQPIQKKESFILQLRRILNNNKFLTVIRLYLLLWCGLQLTQTVAVIYLEQVMGVPGEVAKWILVPFQISALIGLQVWSFFSNKYGRINALNTGGKIWIGACIIAFILPSIAGFDSFNDLFLLNAFEKLKFLLLVITILSFGFGASTAFLIPWSLLPDAIDADPEKPAGIYTAWMVFIQKIGIGLSVLLFGALLSASGYQSIRICEELQECIRQPFSAQLAIRLSIGLIPALLILIGLSMMKRWPTKKAHLLNN